MTLFARWSQALNQLRAQGRYRSLRAPSGLDFTSNDYLGYGNGRLVTPQAALEPLAASRQVTGMASRLLRGHHPLWDEVEAQLASWHGAESALVLTSGYTANEGLISTLAEPGD